MPRGRTPDTVPMQLTLDANGGPRHQQIYAALRAWILNGSLRCGDRLPSTRVLAHDLGVSRTTVLGAFSRLLAEGYVTGKAGAGTRVAALPATSRRAERSLSGAAAAIARADVGARIASSADATPSLSSAAKALFAEGKWRRVPADVVPFAAVAPALELFPLNTWTRLTARRWRLSGRDLLLLDSPRGYEPLREAVAQYAVTARGVRCTPEQVFIVNGAQHALDLCARLLVGPGDKVWMESPGYLPARGVFAASGAEIIDVPIDADGLDVASGRALAPTARLAYVTPSFQFPLGVTMPVDRRLELLEWAREANAWIVEDDYNGEYRYDTAPVPAMQGLDHHGRVLYVGTFSKTLSPAIRLGYLILPPALVAPFTQARLLLDWHSPVAAQAVLADFISSGHFARHIRRTRTLYQQRQRAFVSLAARELAGLVSVSAAPAGMHLVGWLAPDVSDHAVAEEALRRGVMVVAMSSHLDAATHGPGLLFGYAAYTPAQMRVAMQTLAAAIRAVQERSRSGADASDHAVPKGDRSPWARRAMIERIRVSAAREARPL
ncbi:MAG: PLP-dependent aminotransferase family protein [bacterium]